RGGIAVPVHILFSPQLVKDQGELVEKGGVADNVHIGMVGDELAQPFHGVLVGLGLADVECDLVLKVSPPVGGGVVHMDGVPDQVGQEADGVLVEGLGLHRNAAAGIAPPGGRHRLAGGAVHDFPPASDVVAGVHLHQLGADALHQGDGDGVPVGGVKAGHDVALLDLVGVGFGPGVVLAGGGVSGIDLGLGTLQVGGELGAVTVADGVGDPFFQDPQSFGHVVQIGGDGYAAFFDLHRFTPRNYSSR